MAKLKSVYSTISLHILQCIAQTPFWQNWDKMRSSFVKRMEFISFSCLQSCYIKHWLVCCKASQNNNSIKSYLLDISQAAHHLSLSTEPSLVSITWTKVFVYNESTFSKPCSNHTITCVNTREIHFIRTFSHCFITIHRGNICAATQPWELLQIAGVQWICLECTVDEIYSIKISSQVNHNDILIRWVFQQLSVRGVLELLETLDEMLWTEYFSINAPYLKLCQQCGASTNESRSIYVQIKATDCQHFPWNRLISVPEHSAFIFNGKGQLCERLLTLSTSWLNFYNIKPNLCINCLQIPNTPTWSPKQLKRLLMRVQHMCLWFFNNKYEQCRVWKRFN